MMMLLAAMLFVSCSSEENEVMAQTRQEKLYITIGSVTKTATMVDNAATQELVARLQQAPVTVTLNSSAGFNDNQYNGMDYRDVRFNQTQKYLYVTPLGWPDDGEIIVKCLAKGNSLLHKSVSNVYLLGYGKLKARQMADGLHVTLPRPTNKIAPVLRIAK